MQRKYLLLELRRCARCGLRFRWPKDRLQDNVRFYQSAYCESLTTELPDGSQLSAMKQTAFANSQQNLSSRIALLKTLVPTGRVLDYGSSWGYGTYQLLAAGYAAVGLEISRPRAEFARSRLGVSSVSSWQELARYGPTFDAVFACHVLEHLPVLGGIFDRLASLLRPGGVLLAFVPNCEGTNARRLGVRWGPMCCEKHPIAFDAEFFERNLPRHGFEVVSFSDPYSTEQLSRLLSGELAHSPRDGDELVICAWQRARQVGLRPSGARPAALTDSVS